MAQQEIPRGASFGAPSTRSLALASLAALVGALVILVVAVLPVEYGLDPVGAGRVFGLLRAPPPDRSLAVAAPGEAAGPPRRLGPATYYTRPHKEDAIALVLEPYEYLEYKYHLVQDAGMVFAWSADAPLVHDFHGDPDSDPKDVRTYDKSNSSGARGSFIAPVTGLHGWFWENPGGERVTIRLTSAGFYAHAVEFRSDRTQRRRELPDAALPPSTP